MSDKENIINESEESEYPVFEMSEDAKEEEISDAEKLPFPLDDDIPFKKGATLAETLLNLREYKNSLDGQEKGSQEEVSDNSNEMMHNASNDEEQISKDDALRKEFEEALAKEREINMELQERIDELSRDIYEMKDKKYTQAEFDSEAIKTFRLVKDILLAEMKRTDPEAAKKLEMTVKLVFAALMGYSGQEERAEDE